jgi:hypothetical protein
MFCGDLWGSKRLLRPYALFVKYSGFASGLCGDSSMFMVGCGHGLNELGTVPLAALWWIHDV